MNVVLDSKFQKDTIIVVEDSSNYEDSQIIDIEHHGVDQTKEHHTINQTLEEFEKELEYVSELPEEG